MHKSSKRVIAVAAAVAMTARRLRRPSLVPAPWLRRR